MLPAPAHVNQHAAGGVFASGPLKGQSSARSDCMVAVGMMGLDAATGGAIRPSATEFRARQRDQDRNGIGLDDVDEAWRSFAGAPKLSWGFKLWPAIGARLDAGDGVLVAGSYWGLGDHRAPGSSYTGPHGLYLQRRAPGGILLNDPLRHGPAVIPEVAVRRFYVTGAAMAGWAEGGGAGTGGGGAEQATTTTIVDEAGDAVRELVVNGVVLVVVLGLGWAGIKRIVGGTTHGLLVEAPGAVLKLPERVLRR
jgi:hypothetical protein